MIGAGNQMPRTPPADQKVNGELKLIKMISDEILGTDSSLTKQDQILTSEKGMSSPSYNERGDLAQYQNGLISPLPDLNTQ